MTIEEQRAAIERAVPGITFNANITTAGVTYSATVGEHRFTLSKVVETAALDGIAQYQALVRGLYVHFVTNGERLP